LGEKKTKTAYLVETIIGVFAINQKDEVLEKVPYSHNPEKIAISLRKQQDGEITKEVAKVVEGLIKRGFDHVILTNQALADTIKTQYYLDTEIVEVSLAADKLKEQLPELAVQLHIVSDETGFTELGRIISTLLAKGAIHDAMSGKEVLITQTVQLVGELDTALNGLASRVREWYGLNYPELSRLIRDHQIYCKLITAIGDKNNITEEKLNQLGLQRREILSILKTSKDSMGANLTEIDIIEIQLLAQQTLNLYEYRARIIEYISTLSEEIAPNLSYLCGPTLAAKLIEKAGSLRRLAMMPASSIQILGAEKALYRAFKTNSRPPKHGLIFQHPYVNGAPRGLRGLRARHLSAKLAIAARADAFSGNNIAEQLKKELEIPN